MKTLVSLTYDGGLLCHLETALPQLQDNGLKGTFYCEPVPLLENLPEWAKALQDGHEIGNGTLHGAVRQDGTLPGWTMEMVLDDVKEAKLLLQDLFPEQDEHTFGLPWGRPLSDGVDATPVVQQVYGTLRTGDSGLNKPPIDLARLKCVKCDAMTTEALIELAETAHRESAWLIYAFEGVGSGERGVDEEVHRALCNWLAHDRRFETATVVGAAARVGAAAARAAKLV
ncbi:MAG TPA: polysaccharide deacetylase family protein [Fimbriimonadaceae bacterium]|nr:polysaccharide deacetylase family protein [Fimbriimonadaceae bacterium]